jgi:hypothetical protein
VRAWCGASRDGCSAGRRFLGAVFAAVSLDWQTATFKPTGPVIRVKMPHGANGPVGAVLSDPANGDLVLVAGQGYTLEVFAVEVVNTGRMATRGRVNRQARTELREVRLHLGPARATGQGSR